MAQVYHSDVIGSLLRPQYLSRARAAHESGQLSAPEFKRIEDRAVDQAIAMQEGVGLDVITDGEFRRFSFLDQIIGELEGVTEHEGAPVHFRNATNPGFDWHAPFTITGKIRQRRKLTIEEFAYARARATKPVKITLPSPLVLYSMWSPELSTAAYKDAFEMFADAAAIVRAEAEALAQLGCTYIQIDSPDYGTLVDPENRELRENLGIPTERTLTEGADIMNSVADIPGVTFGLHLCKGNYLSQWIGSGGYDLTAEALFNRLTNFDVFLLRVRGRAVRLVRAAGQFARRQGGRARPRLEQDHHAGVPQGTDGPGARGGPLHRPGAAGPVHPVRLLLGPHRGEPDQRRRAGAQARTRRGGGAPDLVTVGSPR